MNDVVVSGAAIIGIALWLFLGYLGGQRVRRSFLRDFASLGDLAWSTQDERLARVLMFAGPLFLLAALIVCDGDASGTKLSQRSWFESMNRRKE